MPYAEDFEIRARPEMPSPEEHARRDPGDETTPRKLSPEFQEYWYEPQGGERHYIVCTAARINEILASCPPYTRWGLKTQNVDVVKGDKLPEAEGSAPKDNGPVVDLRHRAVVTFDGEQAKLTLYKHTDQISLPMTSAQLFRLASQCLEKGLEAARADK